MTDLVLSEFVSSTGVDPAIAQDILDSHQWDLQAALQAFSILKSKDADEEQPFSRTHIIPVTTEVVRAVSLRPSLQKASAVEVADDNSGRKWSRGISRASENLALVTRARSEVAKGFTVDDPACVPNNTFTLPDLTAIVPDDFRAFVENDLIETATLVSLEQAGRLNWWADTKPCQRLLPLATTGDGNCLLHAASLGIWGFHDRLLTLRKSLNHVLNKSEHEASIYRRWRWHQTILNKQSGLIYTEAEWEKEWFGILKLSSTEPRLKTTPYICCDNSPNRAGLTIVEENDDVNDNTQYESLEEVHVFALAYAVKRPIIVIADVYLRDSAGEPLAPIPFGGVYLPLGCDPKNCLRSPLVLTYDAAHFSALVPMKCDSTECSEMPAIIPVTDSQGDLLPIQFLVDPGESFQWGYEDNDPQVIRKLTDISEQEKLHVLQTYIDIVKISVTPKNKEGPSGFDDRRSTADSNSNESETSSGDRCEKDKQKSAFAKHIKTVRHKLKRSISKLTGKYGEDYDFITNGVNKSPSLGMDKNSARELNSARSSKSPVNVNEVEISVRNGSVKEIVFENSTCRWKVDKVKDLQQPGLLRNPNVVLGCPLSLNHETSFHEEMICNYLEAARVRFAVHMKNRERQDNLHQNGYIRCASPGCEAHGSVANNYLCTGCFQRQKLHMEEMKAQRETSTVGKSTFYATAKGDGSESNLPEPVGKSQQRPITPVGAPRQAVNTDSVETPVPKEEADFVAKPCVTPNCLFFGNQKTGYLCSQCFRRKSAIVQSSSATNLVSR